MSNEPSTPSVPSGSPLGELIHHGQLAWRLLRHPRMPLIYKLIPALAVIYIVSPLDLVPDFFPVVGYLDDLTILLLALKFFIQLAPPDVMDEVEGRAQAVPTTFRVHDD